MDIPILGTIDFTPSGLFLFFAAVIAVVYFGYQLFGTGRAGRDAKETEETPQVEVGETAADDAEGADGTAVAEGMADGEGKPTAEIDKDERTKD